jgi:hypothetical protein
MFSLLLSGCEMLPDQQDSRGVKLSDAMRASATGDQHDLGGRRSSDNFPDTSASVTTTVSTGAGMDAPVSYDKNEYGWQMLADASYSLPINSQFESIEHFTLTPIAIEDERNMFGFYFGGADVQLKPGSLADQATDRTWMFEAGFTYRCYLNSSRTAFSPYLTASAGFALLGWSYRSPVTAGGDSFQSDYLYGAEGTVAIGIATRRDCRLGVFAEAGIGGTVFAPVTVNGFDNDVFNNFGFVSFKAGVSLKF